MLTLQDFSLINTRVNKIKDEYELKKASDAFYYLVMENILDLPEDEITDSITDSSFLKEMGENSGHDRGIDAIYIIEDNKPIVHFFNCKYTDKFEKARDNNFPSNEIDKIAQYLVALMLKDEDTINSSNDSLKEKTEDIWRIFETQTPSFILHICSNYDNGMEVTEKARLERVIAQYSNFKIEYHLISDFVKGMTGNARQVINGKFRANPKQLFEKTDGDIRALIININAFDMLRMIMDNEEIRNELESHDLSIISDNHICEDAFYDNVRIYQTQKSRINKSIVQTANSDDRNRFFYYNNGITITCKSFSYPTNTVFPIVTLEGIQIVNGSQTLHALYEGLKTKADYLMNIELLCRIYELKESKHSSKIAEYTNSQNPVTTRDIRSIDYIQQKLESELVIVDYYYERKKDQYNDQPKRKRLDAAKVGQILMAFYNEMPSEAKNDKKLIFGEKYDVIFNDSISADKVLLAYNLYNKIEDEKRAFNRERERMDPKDKENKSYITHATYYILYTIGKIATSYKMSLDNKNIDDIYEYYDVAKVLIEKSIEQEKRYIDKGTYNHAAFFKSARPKVYIEDFMRRCKGNINIETIMKLRLGKK